VFTPFHKPPYTYLYGRSIDKTMTSAKNRAKKTEKTLADADHK
jgi:hypothetical protein